MAQNPNLQGLQGNMQAQPRMFAHDAVGLTAAQIASGTYTTSKRLPESHQRLLGQQTRDCPALSNQKRPAKW